MGQSVNWFCESALSHALGCVLLPTAALETSNNLAKEQGPYETYEGSPMSKGVLQHDMWGVKVSRRCFAEQHALGSMACRLLSGVVSYSRCWCTQNVPLRWPSPNIPLPDQITVSCCCKLRRTTMSMGSCEQVTCTSTHVLILCGFHCYCTPQEPSTRWDWAKLRSDIAAHGVRNSLLVAPMPTASTSQILGNNECFEPYTSNIYVRWGHPQRCLLGLPAWQTSGQLLA